MSCTCHYSVSIIDRKVQLVAFSPLGWRVAEESSRSGSLTKEINFSILAASDSIVLFFSWREGERGGGGGGGKGVNYNHVHTDWCLEAVYILAYTPVLLIAMCCYVDKISTCSTHVK